MQAAKAFGKLTLLRLLLPPLAMLAACLAAGAELEAALAAWLGGLEPGARALLLADAMLGALALPPLCAAGMLWRAHWRRHGGPG